MECEQSSKLSRTQSSDKQIFDNAESLGTTIQFVNKKNDSFSELDIFRFSLSLFLCKKNVFKNTFVNWNKICKAIEIKHN